MKLYEVTGIARKLWTKKKWDDYANSRLCKTISKAVKLYSDPEDSMFDDYLNKGKWKATIDRKVNYLLGRTPTCTKDQETFNSLAPIIRESAEQVLLRGSIMWLVQGDSASLALKPTVCTDAMNVYEDAGKTEVIATIRKYTDVSIDALTGNETETEMFELYYKDSNGAVVRDTFCYSNPSLDVVSEYLGELPVFIELNTTGTAPLFSYAERLLKAFDHTLTHQDTTVQKNTKPLVEVRGYSGTSDDDLEYAVNEMSIVRTDGTGGVNIHPRSMDSAAIDTCQKRLQQEWSEVMSVVTKDNELQYAMSGKALDRLFIDMENSAQELGHVIGLAVTEFFKLLGKDVQVIWNTDKPTDDASTITAIVQSRGILSERTLLEQHPWVSDVDQEIERLKAQKMGGFEDLLDDDEEE